MVDLIVRLFWFAVVGVVIAYGILVFLGKTLPLSSPKTLHAVEVVDQFKPGIHQLTGTILVPSNCHELSVRVENMSPNTYTLVFETWEEPSIPCKNDPVRRPFDATAFAPAVGVKFEAEIDGTPIPIIVKPKVVWQRSTSTNEIIQYKYFEQ